MASPIAARTRSDQKTRVVLLDKVEIASGVIELSLASATGSTLPLWSPGAHIELELPDGEVRQYSLLPPSSSRLWRVAILREVNGRGGSRYIHDRLKPGDELVAHGPRNNFPLVRSRCYVFLAGGIGITPLLSMIEHAEDDGVDWTLVYCGRSRSSMVMLEALERYGPNRVTLNPDDEFGVFDLAGYLAESGAATVVYACGPSAFLDAVADAVRHWPSGSLHVERFAPIEHADTSFDTDFEVELRNSGKVITVPADRSILEVAEQAGVEVLSSCLEGTCGTCETVVLEGKVDHRDCVLSPEEQERSKTMMICVSRSRSARLVLEL
jgi:ferredoxin-NADP reductase